MTMVKWLRKQLHKLETGNSLVQWGNGHWYVQYNETERSCTMYYNTAKVYAEVFGGEVKYYEE